MSEQRESFRELMDRVLGGSETAARELEQRYGAHVRRAVRARLPERLRSKFDSLDFVQDVWMSFFRAPDHDFTEPDDLTAFLARVARHKVVEAIRQRLVGQQYNVNREEPLARAPDQPDQDLVATVDTPSEAAIGAELWEQMLAGQPPVYQLILTELRDGHSQVDIAERLRLSRKTVQRVIERALLRVRR